MSTKNITKPQRIFNSVMEDFEKLESDKMRGWISREEEQYRLSQIESTLNYL